MTGGAQVISAGLLLILAFSAGWAVNGWRADARIARAESSQSKQAQALAQKAQAAIEKKATSVVNHAAAQQDNTHDYMQKLAALEAGRTADAARIAGLQHDVRSAATRSAQLAGDAAACRDLADRHERLAALAAEGAGLVGEADGLVAKRDAQVDALAGQARADRALIDQLQ
jgi:hypothetical protein